MLTLTIDSRPDTAWLQARPVLTQGHTDDLRHEEPGRLRFWLSRTTTADGEPFDATVTIEELRDGSWVTVLQYDGDNPPGTCGTIRPETFGYQACVRPADHPGTEHRAQDGLCWEDGTSRAYRPDDDRPVLEVGRLSIPVGPGPVRCGIHGDPTGSGRCASCDEETDEEEPGPRCPACHDDGTVPDDLAPYGERTCPSCGGASARF